MRAVEQITEVSLSKNKSLKWEIVNKGDHINDQTAVEEFEYSFLCTYVLEFLCTWVLGISVEEYGYPFQRKVQDPLIRKLNCHRVTKSADLKFSYPSTRIGKNDSCRGWIHSFLCLYVLGICLQNMSTHSSVRYQIQVSTKRVSK